MIDAFRRWLTAQGRTPAAPTDHWTDIEAVRDGERLIGEAKGRTKETDVDADITNGQLLRMTCDSPAIRYALIVPTASVGTRWFLCPGVHPGRGGPGPSRYCRALCHSARHHRSRTGPARRPRGGSRGHLGGRTHPVCG